KTKSGPLHKEPPAALTNLLPQVTSNYMRRWHMRLIGYGGDSDNAHKRLDEFDAVDLGALQLAREWGINGNGHKEHRWTYSPCPRPDCGGAIVSGWDSGTCLLCARNGNEPGRRPRREMNPRHASGTL